jgi:hypothetical protein
VEQKATNSLWQLVAFFIEYYTIKKTLSKLYSYSEGEGIMMYLHQTKLRMQAFEKLTKNRCEEQENNTLFNSSIPFIGVVILLWQSLV